MFVNVNKQLKTISLCLQSIFFKTYTNTTHISMLFHAKQASDWFTGNQGQPIRGSLKPFIFLHFTNNEHINTNTGGHGL